jgi:hypothetical protein
MLPTIAIENVLLNDPGNDLAFLTGFSGYDQWTNENERMARETAASVVWAPHQSAIEGAIAKKVLEKASPVVKKVFEKLGAKSDPGLKSMEKYVNDQVSVIWYPRGYHVELKVGDQVYNTILGTELTADIKTIQRTALSGGKAYFDFKLSVTEAEFKRLREYMESQLGKEAFQSCVSGACKALRNNSTINIPPPFRYTPALSATFLTAAKALGYSRITGIRFVGKNAVTSVAIGAVAETSSTIQIGAFGYLLLEGVSWTGEKIVHLIPLDRK